MTWEFGMTCKVEILKITIYTKIKLWCTTFKKHFPTKSE